MTALLNELTRSKRKKAETVPRRGLKFAGASVPDLALIRALLGAFTRI
jgi:hypothetical protein